MAVLQIVMKRKNGGGFDILYPKTLGTQVIQDSANRFVSDAEKTTWNGKIDATEKASNNGVATLDANGRIPISQMPSETREVTIVADITARDNISAPFSGLEVLVIDATADATVDLGWAKYIYDGSTPWVKIGEGESLDQIAGSIDWSAITNKPTSSTAQLDQAVTDSHTHSNKATLDATEEAFTTALKGVYDGYNTIYVAGTEPGGAIDGDFWYETT